MIETEKKVVYKAFGFSVISEIPLPELLHVENIGDSIDIEVKIEDLTKKWFELSDEQNAFVIKENLVMFQVPNIATFSIEEGKKIAVSLLRENDEDVIRLYILGTCMGAILMQRKILPLHGSAVAIDGKAYAFVGNSGAGKSTTASALLNHGYQLLSDDVIAISLSLDGSIPFVTPSYPQQKLWQDSLTILGMESNDYRPIYGREDKYCIPVSSKFLSAQIPLAGVFELKKTENKEFKICPINSLERFYTLYRNTYQNCFIQNLGLMDWHFNTTAKIIDKIDIYQIHRPVSGASSTQIVSQILKTISKGE
ncbi:aldolase [Neobacillus novalis]|uniref:Aldolase n=1 Tax=Neobacillus novalis TaxID=220687 RepID=A0AA95S9X2_9BACI|nr:aldolase [Neobacillus novalis]WHY85212.1 aldolase [Neobacillus novalis]